MLAEARQWFEQWIGAVAVTVDGVAGQVHAPAQRRARRECGRNVHRPHRGSRKTARIAAPLSFRLDHDAPQPAAVGGLEGRLRRQPRSRRGCNRITSSAACSISRARPATSSTA